MTKDDAGMKPMILNHRRIREAVWDAIERRIDMEPQDGINADGDKSERVREIQRAYVEGMRAARLTAIRTIANISD